MLVQEVIPPVQLDREAAGFSGRVALECWEEPVDCGQAVGDSMETSGEISLIQRTWDG